MLLSRSLLHRGIAETLIEPPMMAVGVLRYVAPIGPVVRSVICRLRLRNDLRDGLPRPPAVRLDIIDVDHHVLGIRAAERPGTAAEGPFGAGLPLRAGDQDNSFAEHELGMHDAAIVIFDLETNFEPERVAEPVDRLGGVFVIKPGGDPRAAGRCGFPTYA